MGMGARRLAPAPPRYLSAVSRNAPEVPPRAFRIGVAGCTAAVAAFLLARLTAWPPHEDEVLALYVGGGSFDELLDTVLGERGGAPLHFVFAWVVAHLGGGLGALRLVSALFAVASVPLIALLAARLTDRLTAVGAAALASASWIFLFHGVYARMDSIFLFMSALSFLALLAALREGGVRRFALWVGAILLCVATHPYGALVLASQGIYVLLVRDRLHAALAAFAAVAVLGTPFWIADLVLAGRFDVGVGGGGEKLGGPGAGLRYLGQVAGHFSAGWVVLPVVLFLSALLAAGLAAVARSGNTVAPQAAGLVGTLLLAGGVTWAWDRTPALFTGDPPERSAGREAAAEWLAANGSPNDVLLGYEPVFLDAWERKRDL